MQRPRVTVDGGDLLVVLVVGVGVVVRALVVVVGGRSQTGRAMMVPLRSRLGTTTDPVGVPDPKGVVAIEVSVDPSVSLLGAESLSWTIWLIDTSIDSSYA